MARDNNNGLYLPLKIDLSAWEQSLSQADADLQKAMREMRSSVSDMKLRYDVEIAGAKAAGDQLKAVELEEKKLTAIYETQKRAVEALNKAYLKSVQDKGASAKASQALARQLVNETKAMERTKAQLDARSLNIGKTLSDGLAKVSPEFARIRQSVAGVTSSLSGMGGTAVTVAKAIGGIGVAAAGVAAAYSGAKAISDGMRETAETAANASESVFMLAERLNLTYEEAEQLDAVFTLDGTSAETFVNAVQKLNKQLMTAGEEGNVATNMLARYGVELRNADGTQKTYVQQLQALADGYKKAKQAGEDLDFMTATLGSGGNQFVHLLNGLDDYIAKTNELTRAKQTDYDLNHELLTINGQLMLQQKELAKASGNAYGNTAVEAKKQELEFLKERTRLMNENKELYKDYAENMKLLNSLIVKVEGKTSLWLDRMKNGLVQVAAGWGLLFEKIFGDEKKLSQANLDALKQKTEPVKQERPAQIDTKAEKEALKEQERALEKMKQARERFDKEMRDATATQYEKEIYALEDKRRAYIAEGIAEVDANRLFAEQKSQIEQRYFDKLTQERQKQATQAKQAYEKEIEMAKKAREQSMSEAENTLKNNIKLLRYIQNEQKKGTYTDSGAREYANKLYMRQNGFNMNDVSFMKDFGVGRLQELADARTRIFGQFAETPPPSAPVTSNVTVNFDNTIVEDASAMDKLANKVAEIITPAIQQALRGGDYSY